MFRIPFDQLTPPASLSMRNDRTPCLPVLAHVNSAGVAEFQKSLSSNGRCDADFLELFFVSICLGYIIYILMPRFFLTYYPRHNVTF